MGCFSGGRSRRRLPIAVREARSRGQGTRLPPTSICRAFMAEPETATLAVAPLPSSDDLERAASFTREPFLLEGEDASVALAPGAPRRAALDWALSEIADGREGPSTKWRRRWPLLLGLDRLPPEDERAVVDGTVLSAPQVDALSGTLTALLAESQRAVNGNGRTNGAAGEEPLMLASAAIPG